MKTCIICGARVRNSNPKTNTCRPICTRAKHAGRKLAEQQRHEMELKAFESPRTCGACDCAIDGNGDCGCNPYDA